MDEKILDLWNEFGDVPMNPETEELEETWNEFPVGTHREDIWTWFEDTFNIIIADLLLYHKVTYQK